MANIVQHGSGVFRQLAYAAPHPGTQNFLLQQLNTPTNILTEAGNRFFEGAAAIYERVSGSAAVRAARAAGNALASIWQSNEIQKLLTMPQLQNAPLKMQRFIMADPTVRAAYHRQECDGYSGSYTDTEPGAIGEDHYDYRRVWNGVVKERENGDWYADIYLDELLPEDTELEIDQQVDCILSMAAAAAAIRAKKSDPTSKWDADL